MNLLVMETATDACSVALLAGGRVIEHHTTEPRVHAERLLAMVDACLDKAGLRRADLEALAFGRGPGSFTGVRIATGVIQGLAFGLRRPVVPVSTLAGFAATAHRLYGCRQIAVCVDARMKECYWGLFHVTAEGVAEPAGAERLAAPDALPLPDGGGWLAVGSGWQACPDLLRRMAASVDRYEAGVLPAARDLIATASIAYEAGATVPAEAAIPVYLRDRVAWRY